MTEQYFETQPSADSDPKKVSVTIGDHDYVFETDRGVFSYEKVDKATRILLEVFLSKYYGPSPKSIVDVGSGYGVISCVLANCFVEAELVGIEPNERAQKLSIDNYSFNIGDDRFKVAAPKKSSEIENIDLIVSNPPVRVGKKELYELLKLWSNKLKPAGQMWLVIAKNLGADSASAFLETQCNVDVTRMASKKGFRVLRCKKPE